MTRVVLNAWNIGVAMASLIRRLESSIDSPTSKVRMSRYNCCLVWATADGPTLVARCRA